MFKYKSAFKLKMLLIFIAGILGCVLLYYFNPEESGWMPRCPFLVITGLKCPGCGTLRGIHCLLHLQFANAWSMNPYMILSIPLIGTLLIVPRLARSVILDVIITISIVLYWIMRNLAL